MTDIHQAREWAERWSEDDPLILADAKAAIKLIKGLPDQWIDAKKVRALIASLNAWAEDADAERAHGRALGYRTAAENLAVLLPTPSLPTLADMTQEEREACQWMQARVEGEGYCTFVIASVGEQFNKVLRPDGLHEVKRNSQVTPLPDLPKLKWPGNEPVEPPALPEGMRLADHETLGLIVVSQRADEDGDYAFFESIPGGIAGASWGYVNKSELTFLDGEANE